jgi:cytochrome c-type biogenesis protein CcmH
MRRIALLAAVGLTALTAVATATAPAATPKVGIADVEDEVMCPICGTLLELAESPQAQREKVFVARLIAEGRSKAQIKDALVAQYGPGVLALPEAKGFDLSAYLVPVIAFVLAAGALAAGVWRWRRGGGSEPDPPSQPRGEDAERLDADIARYDL